MIITSVLDKTLDDEITGKQYCYQDILVKLGRVINKESITTIINMSTVDSVQMECNQDHMGMWPDQGNVCVATQDQENSQW